ncbi:MAG: hypothetical protein IT348_07485 [Candidatus Eisenbacteria bacterium]|nr:hypothetical protein [Candidatus Eisenbacteria bacterium]
MNEPSDTPYECIDPEIGAQIGQLERPDLDPAVRATLEAHVSVCHHCHELLRRNATLATLAREGRLAAAPGPGPVLVTRAVRPASARNSWLAGLAFAASLSAVFALPPRSVTDGAVTRGAADARFLRPVEGEVLASRRPTLRWTAIPGATRYHVELRDPAGRAVWSGESTSPSIRLPEPSPLARGGEYRALLSVQPADLLPPGEPSVRFRSGTPGDMAAHRLRWAHPALQGLVLLSLAGLIVTAIPRRRA